MEEKPYLQKTKIISFNEQNVQTIMDALAYIEQDAVRVALKQMQQSFPVNTQQRADASEAFRRYLHL